MSKLAHSNEVTMNEIEAQQRMMDKRANYFAMCLLMPEEAVKIEAAKYQGEDIFEDWWVKKLAKKFGVDEQMMLIRLGQLGFMVSP